MVRTLILTIIAWLIFLDFCHAQSQTLEDLIREAKLNNPEIQALKSHYDAAKARTSEIRYLKDPIISAEFMGNVRMYSVSQQLQFPTKIITLSHLKDIEAEQYETMYYTKILEIEKYVKHAYADLYFVQGKIRTIEESIAFLNQFFLVVSQKYAVGSASQAALLRAQVALSKAETNLLLAEDEKKVAQARLNTLLNKPTDSIFVQPEKLNITFTDTDIEDLYELAVQKHPRLETSRKILQKTKVMVSIAKQMYLPDFLFKFSLEEMDNITNKKYMLGITLPLWFWGKQNHIVKETNSQLSAAKMQYQAIENNTLFIVKEAKVNVDNRKRILELYKTSILPQAKANLNSSLLAYETNQIDFLSLLDSEKVLIQFELEYLQAQVDLFNAIAALEEVVGVKLNN
jgi:outer membrane protein TolC